MLREGEPSTLTGTAGLVLEPRSLYVSLASECDIYAKDFPAIAPFQLSLIRCPAWGGGRTPSTSLYDRRPFQPGASLASTGTRTRRAAAFHWNLAGLVASTLVGGFWSENPLCHFQGALHGGNSLQALGTMDHWLGVVVVGMTSCFSRNDASLTTVGSLL